MSMKSYAPGKDLGEKPWLTLTDFHLYCQWQSVVEFRPQSFLPDRYLGEIKHLASITAHLRPRPHESVFKRKRGRFAPDTAIVHTTSPKTEPFENSPAEWSDLKTYILKTLFSSVDGENDAVWKRWRHQNRHDRAPDHSTVSIQNGGQTLPCGFKFAPISRDDTFIWACALRV